MFRSLKSVIYKVKNIEKATEWYNELLGTEPVLNTSVLVVYMIGDDSLGLVPRTEATSKSDDSTLIYWEVDDVETAYKRMLRLGATPDTEINMSFNIKRATVRDPFGNILGIRTVIADGKESVEQQPSQTAIGVTAVRALAAIDEREEIRGHDYLAEMFLPEEQKALLKNPAYRELIGNITPGMYEYMIARTAYFDNIVEGALHENIPQIVFLGAGYDTRPYRFKDLIKDTRIFELDIHTTQQHKIEVLRQKNIPIPDQLTFVPINFNTEPLEDVLFKAGYKKGQKNLFVWEGVIYYLSPEAVDDTLKFIMSTSSSRSTVSFDYSAHWPEVADAYGVRKSMEFMRTSRPGEPGKFSIERGKIGSFLSERGFTLIDHLTAEEIEKKYLKLKDGSLAGKVVGIFCLAQAAC